tara:strand:+ start:802 stop:1029 length:228 start_codon:yes stop_codon:yes gene_type:complete
MKLNNLIDQWRDAQGKSADVQKKAAEDILGLSEAEQKALAILVMSASPLMREKRPEDVIALMTTAAQKPGGPKPS